jgi:hypothetical protein
MFQFLHKLDCHNSDILFQNMFHNLGHIDRTSQIRHMFHHHTKWFEDNLADNYYNLHL